MFGFRNGKLNALQMYLHRFLRMMPLMIAVILLSMTLLRFAGNGPLWTLAVDLLSGACSRYWWSTFGFIQNYVNPENLVRLSSMELIAIVLTYFDLVFPVLCNHMVPQRRYAVVFHCTGCDLFHSSVQNEGGGRVISRDCGLHRMYDRGSYEE